MIARALTGMARALFLTAVALFALGGLFLYGAWRLLRSATVGAKPMPVREASFALLLCAATLARAIQAQAPTDLVPFEEE